MWPRPASAAVGHSTSVVNVSADRPLFQLAAGGCCRELLESAFRRAERDIFGSETTQFQHMRVRIPGMDRGQGWAPERALCTRDSAAGFTTLSVAVANSEPTRLQLGVDESYTLELQDAGGGGELRASNEWGALRGLETFAQLVQPAQGKLVLCGLPMRLTDKPTFQWRGLLLDTSRHFLPVRATILPMLDAMSALKLNTLHWHLTDAHSFPLGSEAVPELPSAGAYHSSLVYSLSETKAVVAAAHARGIRIVPELDMPAHTASWAHGMVRPPAPAAACQHPLLRVSTLDGVSAP